MAEKNHNHLQQVINEIWSDALYNIASHNYDQKNEFSPTSSSPAEFHTEDSKTSSATSSSASSSFQDLKKTVTTNEGGLHFSIVSAKGNVSPMIRRSRKACWISPLPPILCSFFENPAEAQIGLLMDFKLSKDDDQLEFQHLFQPPYGQVWRTPVELHGDPQPVYLLGASVEPWFKLFEKHEACAFLHVMHLLVRCAGGPAVPDVDTLQQAIGDATVLDYHNFFKQATNFVYSEESKNSTLDPIFHADTMGCDDPQLSQKVRMFLSGVAGCAIIHPRCAAIFDFLLAMAKTLVRHTNPTLRGLATHLAWFLLEVVLPHYSHACKKVHKLLYLASPEKTPQISCDTEEENNFIQPLLMLTKSITNTLLADVWHEACLDKTNVYNSIHALRMCTWMLDQNEYCSEITLDVLFQLVTSSYPAVRYIVFELMRTLFVRMYHFPSVHTFFQKIPFHSVLSLHSQEMLGELEPECRLDFGDSAGPVSVTLLMVQLAGLRALEAASHCYPGVICGCLETSIFKLAAFSQDQELHTKCADVLMLMLGVTRNETVEEKSLIQLVRFCSHSLLVETLGLDSDVSLGKRMQQLLRWCSPALFKALCNWKTLVQWLQKVHDYPTLHSLPASVNAQKHKHFENEVAHLTRAFVLTAVLPEQEFEHELDLEAQKEMTDHLLPHLPTILLKYASAGDLEGLDSLICIVPYLRGKDIKKGEPAERLSEALAHCLEVLMWKQPSSVTQCARSLLYVCDQPLQLRDVVKLAKKINLKLKLWDVAAHQGANMAEKLQLMTCLLINIAPLVQILKMEFIWPILKFIEGLHIVSCFVKTESDKSAFAKCVVAGLRLCEFMLMQREARMLCSILRHPPSTEKLSKAKEFLTVEHSADAMLCVYVTLLFVTYTHLPSTVRDACLQVFVSLCSLMPHPLLKRPAMRVLDNNPELLTCIKKYMVELDNRLVSYKDVKENHEKMAQNKIFQLINQLSAVLSLYKP